MTTERISSSIILDPSLILARNSIQNTFDTVKGLSRLDNTLKFYYPKSLLRMPGDSAFSQERFGEYFLHNAYPAKPADINRLIDIHSDILSGFEATQQDMTRHSQVSKNLREDLYYLEEPFNTYVIDILMEEWIFLQEHSWVVSRIKKPFNRFVDAGAVCLQFGSRAVNTIMTKTLKKNDNEILSKVDRLRAFGKWVAVGGAAVIGVLNNPMISIPIATIAGFSLLFDPSEGQIWESDNE